MTTIEQEAQACRTAFAAVPYRYGQLVWCCHHWIEIEPLTEPPENRIAYILQEKPEHEQAIRLRNFRPVCAELPEAIAKAHDEWGKARVELVMARAEFDKASAKWGKARVELVMAIKENAIALAALHAADVPGHTWNGTSIFDKAKP